MKRTALTAIALLLAQSAAAENHVVYQNGTLSIPAAAMVRDDGSARYYADVELLNVGEGQFHIVQADAKPLVQVESVEVLIMESFPVQVSVSVEGFKSVPCVELLTPAVSYADGLFRVVLAESELGPAESCIAVLDPFETSVSLPVKGLEAGEYTVNVNGVEADFTLDTDNPL